MAVMDVALPQARFASRWDKNKGILSTQILDYELTPTLSYQITDVVAIGAGLRIGITTFAVDDNESAFHARSKWASIKSGTLLLFQSNPSNSNCDDESLN